MADLFWLLSTLGIEPIGALDFDFTDIVHYREVGEINPAQDSASTPAQADLDLIPILPVLQRTNVESLNANPVSSSGALKVELRDSARFCFVDFPDDDVFVTIVDSESNPELGFINKDTPVARALLGAAIGQECLVHLPMGKRTIRVLQILKPGFANCVPTPTHTPQKPHQLQSTRTRPTPPDTLYVGKQPE
jgi:hypothetical protein